MSEEKRHYHLDISFIKSPQNLGLFNLYQLFDFACSSDFEMPKHLNPCHEISYAAAGEGIITRNNKAYEIKAGMLFLVKKGDFHSITSSKHNPLRYIGLAFDFNEDHPSYQQFSEIGAFFDNLSHPVANDLYNIYNPLTAAISEISTPHFLSLEMLKAYMIQIIISAYRSFHNQPSIHYSEMISNINLKNTTNPLVYEIINYIDMNLTNIGKLTELSKTLGYSYGYLSKLFSKNMNMTIKGYYNQKRFEKAAEMLREDTSVTEISEKLGYADIQSFCRAFKQYYQLSPSQYRELTSK